jgi:hypothetical protein
LHRRAAALVLGLGALLLLLTPGAPGLSNNPVPGDPTPPAVTPVIVGNLGAAGWYTSNVTVSWAVVDPESLILSTTGCDTRTLNSDTISTQLACRAESDGGETTVSKGFKLDKTAPAATATASRSADANGWHNHELSVSFTGSDATSGLESCSAPQTYGGPDTTATSLSGTCRDRAGNTAAASFALKYDETAPQASAAARAADLNGWYNHAVTVGFQGTDATSRVGTCSQVTYAGPDDPSVALAGTCTDMAGNQSAPAVFTLKYDETAPQGGAAASRGPDVNGWFNRALSVSFAGSDAVSGLDSCDPAKTYSGPDAATASVTGACRDRAGNVAPLTFAFKYDQTAPQASATPSRQPNANGWYNASLTVTFSATDAVSGVDSCTAPRSYAGPDSASAVLSGTCHDRAGNAAAASFPVKYDAAAPQTSATPSRQPNSNGWYKAPLTVTFAGSDATSGVEVCDPVKTYSGPDTAGTSVTGTCRDRAGNSTAGSLALHYDGTGPLVTASPSRTVGTNGWYNAPLTVSFAGVDATSGIASCDPARSYAGPDIASTVVAGTCLDKAGNAGSGSLGLKYDATAPQSSAVPSRAANANGWYNSPLTVSFAASDPISGLDSCPAAATYSGPDSGSAVVSGLCVDRAGNGAVTSFALRYDATAPEATASSSRAADANGWFNHPLTVGFQGTDATSGTDNCTAPQTYAGPDTSAAFISGSCRDRAGNVSVSRTFQLKYDATAPQVTAAVAGRGPDQAGWYNHPVAFTFLGSDTTAGIDSCPAATYGGPDSANTSVAGTCVDKAGNRGSRSFALRYDATGPEAVASADREPGSNGWYNRPVTVSFSGSDPISGLEACAPPRSYDGPDGGFAVVGGTCFDKAGNVGLASYPLRYDATAPHVTGAAAARPPDSNGWYNRPLAVTFQGSDATSEIDACTVADYSGPDAAATTVSGSCRDRAGNGSTLAAFPLRYDSTPPSLTDVRVKPGNRSAVLSWRASPDTRLVEIVRTSGSRAREATVYRGTDRSFTDGRLTNGTEYRYTVTAYDEAHNSSARGLRARPTAPLFAPAAGATVTAPPRLAWTPVAKATYYNVQLWRNGKIFSAWPKRASLKLRRTWTFEGRRYRLLPGRYRWYVWPGYGRRAAGDYGRRLGSSSFVVKA